MIPHRHQVTGIDMFGATCFHAVRIGPDDWIATRPDGWNLIVATRQRLISYLADLVMEKRPDKPGDAATRMWNACTRIESSYRPHLYSPIDLAGNMWIGPEYQTPAQYLPYLIPEEPDGDGS